MARPRRGLSLGPGEAADAPLALTVGRWAAGTYWPVGRHAVEVVAETAAGDSLWAVPVALTVAPGAVAGESGPGSAPATFALDAPYPNPTSGAITVPMELPVPIEVRLAVYDVLGRRVATVHDGPLPAGRHALSLGASRLSAGVYLVRAESAGVVAARRLTVFP